jgi:hypothetical protein
MDAKNIDPRVSLRTSILVGALGDQPREINLLHPKPSDIRLEDIAYGLAHLPRFNGQTTFVYSVAHHSMLVAKLAQRMFGDDATVRAAFLHDAAEAYIGDVISPVKWALRELELSNHDVSSFDLLEERWMAAICERFDVRGVRWGSVDECDRMAFRLENGLLRKGPAPSAIDRLHGKYLGGIVLECPRAEDAQARFMVEAAHAGIS